MKKVRIFIGSSILEFSGLRSILMAFIGRINNLLIDRDMYVEGYVCEETSHAMRLGGSQKQHNDYIRNRADIALFLFHTKAGVFTLEEMDIAFSAFESTGHPEILVFFQSDSGHLYDGPGIRECAERLRDEYGTGYTLFDSPADVEFALLELISQILGLGEPCRDKSLARVSGMSFRLDMGEAF